VGSPRAARNLAGRHPEWSYVELEGIGHAPMLEDPTGFASTVQDWLDGLEPAGSGGRRTPPD
jgi:pimeloyl-ACP methyl ester carboxylesterase